MTLALKQKESLKMRFLYFTRYFADGCVYGFLSCYFLLAFTDPLEVGVLLSSIPLTSLVGNMLIGRFSGDEKRNLFLLRILVPLEAAFICTIGFVRFSFAVTLLFSLIGNFICSSIYNLLDSIAGDIQSVEGGKFTTLRSFGALGYLFGALAIGYVVEAFPVESSYGYGYAFVCVLPVYLALVLLSFTVTPLDIGSKHPEVTSQKYSYKSVITNRNYLFYWIFISFLIGGLFISDNLYTDYWNLGTDGMNAENNRPSFLGISTAIFELAEFLTGIVMAWYLSTKKLKNALAIGCFAQIVRLIGLGVITLVDVKARWGFGFEAMALLIGVNSLRGVVFGCFTASLIPVLNNILGLKNKTKGVFLITWGYGLVSGVGQLVLKYGINGFKSVSGSTGHYPIFFLLTGMAVVLFLLIPYINIDDKKSEKEGEGLQKVEATAH